MKIDEINISRAIIESFTKEFLDNLEVDVAIAGAGPSGMTAAYYLAKQGHKVTVFEALPVAGGMMRVGIPEYRLPRDIMGGEIEDIKSFGVEIKLNTKVESLDHLFEQGYHGIFLGLGSDQTPF